MLRHAAINNHKWLSMHFNKTNQNLHIWMALDPDVHFPRVLLHCTAKKKKRKEKFSAISAAQLKVFSSVSTLHLTITGTIVQVKAEIF